MKESIEIGRQVLKLPKLTNNQNVISQQRLDKLFYPHFQNNRLKHKIHFSSAIINIPNKQRSKSVLTTQVTNPIDLSKIIREEEKNSHIKQINQESYQKRRRFKRASPRFFRLEESQMYKKMKQQPLRDILIIQKQKLQPIQQKIKDVLNQIYPLSSKISLQQFIQRYDQMKKFLKQSKADENKIVKIIKSEKNSEVKKFQSLDEKRQDIEQQLSKQYERIFNKHFKEKFTDPEFFQIFKKNFVKQLHSLSRTLISVIRT